MKGVHDEQTGSIYYAGGVYYVPSGTGYMAPTIGRSRATVRRSTWSSRLGSEPQHPGNFPFVLMHLA
jgi:hypothetical protein